MPHSWKSSYCGDPSTAIRPLPKTSISISQSTVLESQFKSATIPASNVDAMRRTGDHMRDRLGSGIVVLGSVVDERPVIIVMATADIAGKQIHAGNIAKGISATIGGGGGGRPDSAQAGARDPSRVVEALENARSVIESFSEPAKQTAG